MRLFIYLSFSLLFSTSVFAHYSDSLNNPPFQFSQRWTVDIAYGGLYNTQYHLGFKKSIHQFYIGIGPSFVWPYSLDDIGPGYKISLEYNIGKNRSKFACGLDIIQFYWFTKKGLQNFQFNSSYSLFGLSLGYLLRFHNGFDFGMYYVPTLGIDSEYKRPFFLPLIFKFTFGLDIDKMKPKR